MSSIDKLDIRTDPAGVWERALSELQHQMTQGTFNRWLRPTRALPSENGTLRVEVRDKYAVDWLSNRLRGTVEREVAAVIGKPVEVQFVVADDDLPSADDDEDGDEWTGFSGLPEWAQTLIGNLTSERDALLQQVQGLQPQAVADVVGEPEQFATSKAGYVPMPNYCQRFWAPLLKRIPWRVWELILREDRRPKGKRTAWTPERRFSAPKLADEVPCGVQALSGTWRRCEPDHPKAAKHPDREDYWRRWQRGAFDRLQAEGLAVVQVQGGWRHRSYVISMRAVWPQFPLLRPAQVARLRGDLQAQHETWLENHGFDPREWDVR